jgi:hypothetical protein
MAEKAPVVESTDRVHSEPAASSANGKPKPNKPKARVAPPAPKSKPTKIFPTDRTNHASQLQMARGYAIASGPERKAVTNADVAKLVDMQDTTVAMSNAFFVDIGFLQKSDTGFIPASELFDFDHAFQWNAETAALKLSPLIERSWFMQLLLPRLRFHNSMEEREVLELLASESKAAPQHRKQLIMLLDYAVVSGLIQRENGSVRINQNGSSGTAVPSSEPKRNSVQMETPASSVQPSTNSPLAAALFPGGANGAVHFNISVQVNMAELSGWQPDRIATFFAGIAQVLAARGKTEDASK